ncbi:MAG: SH3 domain-containing protein [Salaquimonas sp.]
MLLPSIKTLLSVSILTGGMFIGQSLAPSMAMAETKGASGLPLPRFVSLKSQKVNMRVGPGQEYKVDWMYTKAGLPLEILQEYDNWRKVRDSEGSEGWISQALLSGKRTAIVAPWKRGDANSYIPLVNRPENKAAIVAKMEPGLLISVDECEAGWCSIEAGSTKGFAAQDQLWGVYPNERVD